MFLPFSATLNLGVNLFMHLHAKVVHFNTVPLFLCYFLPLFCNKVAAVLCGGFCFRNGIILVQFSHFCLLVLWKLASSALLSTCRFKRSFCLLSACKSPTLLTPKLHTLNLRPEAELFVVSVDEHWAHASAMRTTMMNYELSLSLSLSLSMSLSLSLCCVFTTGAG